MEIQREIFWDVFGVKVLVMVLKTCFWLGFSSCVGVFHILPPSCILYLCSPLLFTLLFPTPSPFLASTSPTFLFLLCFPIPPPVVSAPAALLAGPVAVQSVGVGVGQLSGPLSRGATLRQLGGF